MLTSKTKQIISRVRKMIYDDYLNDIEENKNSPKLLDLISQRMRIKENDKAFHEEVKKYRTIFELVDKVLEEEEKIKEANNGTDKSNGFN